MRIKGIMAALCIGFSAAVFSRAADEEIPIQEITVRYGDTLWGVANKYLKDPKRWPEILKYNRFGSTDPNVILPGMTLRVPVILIKEHLRTAELVSMLNDVRYRRQNETLFKKAELHMKLNSQDSLRTFRESQAQIKFSSGELLRVDQNSFIIVRPERTMDEISLLAGAVRASRTKVLAADTVVMPQITPRAEKTDFKTRLKENKTTLVEVYEGIVDVTAQGETVTLTQGYGTEVPYLKPPSLPKKLPPLPQVMNEFIPGTEITAQSVLSTDQLNITLKPPKISGDYGRAKVLGQLINQYHLQIASDPAFKNIILDEINPLEQDRSIDLTGKKIPDGTYYYRISYIDELEFEGAFTQPKQFTIDHEPPPLELYEPKDGSFIQDEFVRVSGKTDPGALVTINDTKVDVGPDGMFQISLVAKYKEVALIITAEDLQGNLAKVERHVIYLPGKEKTENIFSKPANILLGILSFSVIAGVVALIF